VLVQVRRLQVDDVSERPAHVVEPGGLDLDSGCRLRVDRGVRDVGHGQLVEQRARLGAEHLDEIAVERPARPPPERRHREIGAAQAIEERGVHRDLGDPRGDRDPIAAQPPRAAVAVDLLVNGQEPGLDSGAEPEPHAGERGDLAVGAAVAGDDLARPRRCDTGRAEAGEHPGLGSEVRQVGGQHVARAGEVGAHRRRLHGDLVATQHRGRLVCVCRAADVLEEGRVVDVGRRPGADVRSQPGRDDGRPRGLAGLEAHAHVRDERQPDQELGQSDPRLVHAAKHLPSRRRRHR
jgi:hypothetical protein